MTEQQRQFDATLFSEPIMLNTTVRRKDRTLSMEESFALLDAAEHGVLSLVDGDGSPYGVPLDFARDGDILLLHGSTEGRKIDCLRHEQRVSFCVIGNAEALREKFTTRYESVIVAGRIEFIDDDVRKLDGLMKFCAKFVPENKPNHRDAAKAFAEKYWKETVLFALHIESIAGKANRS